MEQSPTVFGGLLDDLRRRKVFRVAAGYAIVAWVSVEVSSVVVPALRLPEWVVTAVVVAALAGFPITVLLAWVFDLSSGGLVRTRPSGAGHPAAMRVAAQRGAVVLAVAGILAGSGYLAWETGLIAGPEREQSIAVLPFVDLSEGNDSEYFSDGIAEELLNSLVGLDGLRVAARTSSFAFKGRQADVREIGRQLNVSTVLEGSVRRSGNRVRITAQLIDVDNGFHLWSSTYDRELDDIFRIQDEIAHNIADALKLELIGADTAALADRSIDIRAYDLYLLGRHHWHQRTGESLERALELFREAAALDPDFALAHTGIADAWLLLAGYGDVDPDEAARRAETAVARALSLDDKMSEAYASLGLLRLHQHDLAAAELALRGAIQLNPNNSMAHMWLGLVLDITQGPRASAAEFTRAHDIDPLHPVVTQNLAGALATQGDYPEAVAELEAAAGSAAAREDRARLLMALASLHAEWDRFDRAAAAARQSLDAGADETYARMILGLAFVGVGEFERAEEVLGEFETPEQSKVARFVAELRFNIALGRGDLEALDRLAGDLLAELGDPAEVEKADLPRLVLPGAARIVAGDHLAGAELVLAALESREIRAPSRVLLLGLAAYGLGRAGDPRAEEVIGNAREVIAGAREEGWSTPGLVVGEAYLELVAGRQTEALALFDAAADLGWAGYYLLAGHPASAPLLAGPEFAGLAERLKSRVEGMRTATLEAAGTSSQVALLRSRGS